MSSSSNHIAARPRRPRREARRIYVVGGVLVLGLMAVVARLAVLQIGRGEEFAEQARRQYESRVTLQAERGAIYDRNGNLLATNSKSISLAVDPRHVENPRRLAKSLGELFGNADELRRKIAARDRAFVWLKRKVSGTAADRLAAIDDDGLIKIEEPLRHFEYGTLGAQVVGCTDVDNKGLGGVELYYNEQLKGRDGFMIMQRDARGRRRPDVDFPRVAPEHGDGLVLTIDINIQGIVEDELRRGVEGAEAASGTAVAIDPRTGELLAIASSPGYDPNNLRDANPSTLRVRAITDSYEPGSTMKAITAAAAIEENVVELDEMIDGEGGQYQLATHVIRDDHPAGMMSFRKALEESSNIAFAKVASRIPAPRFYKYVRDFGFGIVSGVDLPGEARGEVKKPSEFEAETESFMAFGYQLAVTPLQLVAAYAAIANDGVMMKPHLLKRRLNREGEVIEEIAPQQIRQVVSARTAHTVRDMLVGVVENGTGGEARIAGLKIAGKTGTSQQLSGGEYSKEKYNASFIGFFPADDPRVVLLVLLDNPKNGYYGGQVAAPIFRAIARRIANATMQTPEPDVRVASATVDTVSMIAPGDALHLPDLRGVDAESAKRIAERAGFRAVVKGDGSAITGQTPSPRSLAPARSVITLVAEAPTERKMPDVRGMSLRRAINLLNKCRVRPRTDGSGRVRAQTPAPGASLKDGAEAMLVCE